MFLFSFLPLRSIQFYTNLPSTLSNSYLFQGHDYIPIIMFYSLALVSYLSFLNPTAIFTLNHSIYVFFRRLLIAKSNPPNYQFKAPFLGLYHFLQSLQNLTILSFKFYLPLASMASHSNLCFLSKCPFSASSLK